LRKIGGRIYIMENSLSDNLRYCEIPEKIEIIDLKDVSEILHKGASEPVISSEYYKIYEVINSNHRQEDEGTHDLSP